MLIPSDGRSDIWIQIQVYRRWDHVPVDRPQPWFDRIQIEVEGDMLILSERFALMGDDGSALFHLRAPASSQTCELWFSYVNTMPPGQKIRPAHLTLVGEAQGGN